VTQHDEAFSHFSLLCPKAAHVYLMGEFNNWSTTATPMQRSNDQLWELSIPVPSNSRRYGYFVIDKDFLKESGGIYGKTFVLPV
jgi:1,4-alpha-glucan branching enzyme